jgi:hypothetical protein
VFAGAVNSAPAPSCDRDGALRPAADANPKHLAAMIRSRRPPTMSGHHERPAPPGSPATGLALDQGSPCPVGSVAGIFWYALQETASRLAGKGRIRARLITYAKNTCNIAGQPRSRHGSSLHPWVGESRGVCSRRRRPLRGAGEPVLKSGRGGCSAPWTVAVEHVEQICLASAAPLRARARAMADGEVRDAQVDRSVRRNRRSAAPPACSAGCAT